MTESCCKVPEGKSRKPHLLIVGGGSAAFAAALKASELGGRATIVNEGLPIGGTCVNVGCVPSKTLVRAAEAHHRAAHPPFAGITAQSRISDFRAVIEQKRTLVSELRQAKYVDVVKDLEDVTLMPGRARLLSPTSVEVNGRTITGDRVLIATGASPAAPPIPGLAETHHLTNELLFELDELPESLLVLGGSYVAVESAQMFARFGSKVTLLQRSPRILKFAEADLTNALTGYLEAEGLNIVTGVAFQRAGPASGGGVEVEVTEDGTPRTFRAEKLLVAAGRAPNTADLGLEELGIGLAPGGFLKVEETLRATVDGIYGAGDVIGPPMFVYTAAYEGTLAAENALAGTGKARDYTGLPWVVFTDPQLAGVGFDEAQAREAGYDAQASTVPLSAVPRALAARDTRGFLRLVRDRKTDRILGARVLAPEGSELLMEAALAIRHGITASDLARAFHPYLTLSEGWKLAAIGFEKDVGKLSCCAS